MQIVDFIQNHISPKATTLITYESGIEHHLDAYLQQIFPEGKILIVTEGFWREYVERSLIPSLKSHGCDSEYCLCVKSAGSTYRAQIEESLGDGALSGVIGIASLGSNELFAAARECAGILDIACCALLHVLPDLDVLNACNDARPTPDAIFFALDAIFKQYHGDFREKIAELDVDVYALKADIAMANALGIPIPNGVSEALKMAIPPRMPQTTLNEDDLAELCEAYMWRSTTSRVMQKLESFRTILQYHQQAADFPAFSAKEHAQIMASLFDAALELEALEISPDDSANRQPPKDILNRTLQQILLEDGLKFDWLKIADEHYQSRNDIRLQLNTLALSWESFCEQLKPIADMMHILGNQTAQEDEDDWDVSLRNLWIHASRFAPPNTFLKVFHYLNIIEPTLFI